MKHNGNDRLLRRSKRLRINWELFSFLLSLGLPFLGLLATPLGEDAYAVGLVIMKLQIFGAVVPAYFRLHKTWIVMCLGAVLWNICFAWSQAIPYMLKGYPVQPESIMLTIGGGILDFAIGLFLSFAIGAVLRILTNHR